jgi:hypothetical protein
MTQQFLTTLFSGLFTVAAALIGVGFGIRQFKQQRAFERRLDWYEQTMKVIVPLQLTLNDLYRYLPLVPLESLANLYERVPGLENTLAVHLAQAEVYVGNTALPATRTLLVNLLQQRLDLVTVYPNGTVPHVLPEQVLYSIEQRKKMIDETAVKLAAELRKIVQA